MSRFLDENTPFIEAIKEIPVMLKKMGYNPIDPRIVNSRTGIYMLLLALFRLPEFLSETEFTLYITSKIGKELNLDPYELLTPSDYRSASGTKKIEYRTRADTRAFSMINNLINDCKALHREVLRIQHSEDIPEKVAYVASKAEITFKRIVSLSEFSFGGAYLLDEDVHTHIIDFEETIKDISFLSTSSPDYKDLTAQLSDIEKIVKNSKKLSALSSEDFKKLFFKAHDTTTALVHRVRKKIEDKARLARVLDEAESFSKDFISRVKESHADGFDIAGFIPLPNGISTIKQQYEGDIESLKGYLNKSFDEYRNRCPDQIVSRGNVNPSHIQNVSKKFYQSANDFYKKLDLLIMFDHTDELRRTFESIEWFYLECDKRGVTQKSFYESLEKTFKFKKRISDIKSRSQASIRK